MVLDHRAQGKYHRIAPGAKSLNADFRLSTDPARVTVFHLQRESRTGSFMLPGKKVPDT